jgi:4-alpha-glucanotransferase
MVDHEAAVSAIDALAEAYGIEATYIDARGERQTASETAKRSLLRALGAAAGDDDAARYALRILNRKAWLRVVPPVLVTSALDDLRVEVTLPAMTRSVDWRLTLEDGSQRSGSARFAALDRVEMQTVDGEQLERRLLSVPGRIPFGYHRLGIDGSADDMVLIAAPSSCVLPQTLADRAAWGVAVQLYALRSTHDWGIGDFSDLQRLAGIVADRGGDVIGLNPLHALFPDEPEHASPYSPASRLLINVLNIDVTAVPGFDQCSAAQQLIASTPWTERLAASRNARLVDYTDVAERKMAVLRLVFDTTKPRSRAFDAFVRNGGAALHDGCLFAVLRDHFTARDSALRDWHEWPAEFHNPRSRAVHTFEAEHQDDLVFHLWLQWVADEQLAGAAADAAARGMRIGLFRDLAVGSDPNGVEAWSKPTAVVQSATVGAPPDIYNPPGQNWGLPPFHPLALRDEAYQSFIELVRSNMRHAGAIRIDHVMALQHVYLIPANAEPAGGAYVRYPLDDLIGILALESMRNTCLVIGEDLGTVPAGFRERMSAANILSYRVLFFEKTPAGDAFLTPDSYPRAALAVTGSHDLPTLRAWLEGSDIALRAELGVLDDDAATAQRDARVREREELITALLREGLIAPGDREDAHAIVVAAHAFLARSPATLVMAQIDDIAGEVLPVNVPTTTDQYPNWRRRISLTLEELPVNDDFLRIADAFTAAGRAHG